MCPEIMTVSLAFNARMSYRSRMQQELIRKKPMHRQVNIRVDDNLKAALEALAAYRYCSVSTIMREALLDILRKHDRIHQASTGRN